MPIILPLLCFFSTILVLRKFRVLDWRGSFLLATLFWGFLVTAMTEFLSLLRWLDFWPVFGAWGIVFLLLLLTPFHSNRNYASLRFNLHLATFPRFELSLLVCLLFIVVVIGVIAWVAPPNTSDSMTYHMSRVVHWIQNKSVAFYPTSILRQLHQSPWSEFAILHFQILAGGDRFANFIQWFSMVGSLVGVSLLAKEFNATTRGQIFAAVVCATIPMGILQSSSTQTDYVVSFWLVCFVYFAMLLRTKANLLYALGVGAALGLAILTKATAYIFAFPFLAWLVLSSIKPRHPRKLLFIALALVITFVINLGHYARNFDLYGSPFGPGQEGASHAYANDAFTFSAASSNVIRNVGLHLATPLDKVNAASEKAISLLHKFSGIPPNDVGTTWAGTEFHVPQLSFHEDFAGNPIHLILIAISLLLYVAQRPRERDAGLHVGLTLLAFLLFCVYLKWQPWHSRLHLPLFVLFAPFLGLIISRIRYDKLANAFMLLLIVMGLPWVFGNSSKPFFGNESIFSKNRIEQYFRNRPSLAHPYAESVQIFSGLHCSNIGLVLDQDAFEYPLWVLLHERAIGAVRLDHVNVTNVSQRKYDENHLGALKPCALFVLSASPPSAISIGDTGFLREWSSNPVAVYKRASAELFAPAAVNETTRNSRLSEFTFGINGNAAMIKSTGWANPDSLSTWTDGQRAELLLPVQTTTNTNFELRLLAAPFVSAGKLNSQLVVVRSNGAELTRWMMTGADDYFVSVPPKHVRDGTLQIELVMPNATSPASLGLSDDPRRLGIAVRSLRVAVAQRPAFPVQFNFADLGNASAIKKTGWANPEAQFTWTNGQKAELQIPLPTVGSGDLKLVVAAMPLLTSGKLDRQLIIIRSGGEELGRWTMDHTGEYTLGLPTRYVISGVLRLEFEIPNAATPISLHLNQDTRALGMALYWLKVEQPS